jgi:hypothetical protein
MRKLIALALLFPLVLFGRKFYRDDPLAKEPAPLPAPGPASREINDFFDVIMNTLGHPGERQPVEAGEPPIPAQAVNTLGEVPDSAWFTNRIGSRPIPLEEIARGSRSGKAPSLQGSWTITAAKTQGVTPGFEIEDSEGRRYVLKFDPLPYPEMATGAEMIGTILFHNLGYHVPENYLVSFPLERLRIGADTVITDRTGRERPMTWSDVTQALKRVFRDNEGHYRGLASLFLPGKPLEGFRYHGTRSDDPNDIVPHEHRRDLRGLFVFAAWVNHNDSRSINSLDMLVEENGVPYVKHHLIDFGAILGSSSITSNTARDGNTYFFGWKPAAVQFLSLGLAVPEWARSDYIDHPALGKIEYPRFEPEEWKPNYPSPAFLNRLPDDTYWAAKKVMSFSDEHIRAIVAEARYSDPEAASWIVKYLIHRRDIIGKTYFSKVLPLDNFAVRDGRLQFEDLEVKYGFVTAPREYQAEWSRFDNEAESHSPLPGARSLDLPSEASTAPEGAYFAARLHAGDPSKTVTVYLRQTPQGPSVVGIDRTW